VNEGIDYRGFFEKSPWPIFVIDQESMAILAFNEAALERYGFSRDELLAMRATDLRPPEDVEQFARVFREHGETVDRPRLTAKPWRHRRKDGTIIDVEVWRMTVSFGGRRAQMAMIQDVTARLALERQLRQAQKLEAVGLLAGGIAHDFNNLLSVILASSQLAQRALESGALEKARDGVNTVAETAGRAAAVTRQLLAFAKAQVLRVAVIDLGQVISGWASLFGPSLGEDVTLQVLPQTDRLLVKADRTQVEQLLLNLCANARQAMPAGGHLTLETRRTTADADFAMRHPWARVGDFAELSVSDSGAGMDSATLARAFEPFFTTKANGTGLGLAVVYGIVQQHDACIGVESSPGIGTRVRVLWPIVAEASPERPKEVPIEKAPPPGHGETVLIAEDEPHLRRLLARWLKETGYDVLVAEDGETACRLFAERSGNVDLVLLDVVMPKLGGPQALSRMRGVRAGLPAIFMSGYAPDRFGLGEIEPGCVVLSKPFDLNELGLVLRQALDGALRARTTSTR
jgi:PAS domain S-box-containing protein